MLIRARDCGAFAVAVFALVISTAVPAHADVIPAPEETVDEVVDQPVTPDPLPSSEPSAPEESVEPAPTEPVPTAVPIVPPPAPVGTATFEPTRPVGTVVEYFRSGNATTPGGTGAEAPRTTSPAPRSVEPEEERPDLPTTSPSPGVGITSPTPVGATASPSPVVAREPAGSGAAMRPTSTQKAPVPTVANLLVGMMVLVGGLLIVRYRGPVYAAAVRAPKRRVTSGPGERTERLQGPFRVGVAGAVVALVGVTMNGYAWWQLWSSLSS
ncbi:hypothetical protein QE410_001260 [Microbacterium sp. SORGH_AS 1204]|uniref:hypothetical protein n=1 Tax=Microbacterium sp. SORGH_AS_1204 TaxID=3041785 RepID=UPI002794365C|nr:hypothetical protein [Microbacterium sp. SORGH_AS_1204]MDQ1136461.1 hypothetical protein [Microbacterium sp. SORGH_AS_1204]